MLCDRSIAWIWCCKVLGFDRGAALFNMTEFDMKYETFRNVSWQAVHHVPARIRPQIAFAELGTFKLIEIFWACTELYGVSGPYPGV